RPGAGNCAEAGSWQHIPGDGRRSGFGARAAWRCPRLGDRGGARRLFEGLGVWDAVAGEAQPILEMIITDSRLENAVRPTFLSFAGDVAEGEPFAHMIENGILMA